MRDREDPIVWHEETRLHTARGVQVTDACLWETGDVEIVQTNGDDVDHVRLQGHVAIALASETFRLHRIGTVRSMLFEGVVTGMGIGTAIGLLIGKVLL